MQIPRLVPILSMSALTAAVLALNPAAAQMAPASGAASGATGNKAAKPPVDAMASQSGVATKKPAKAGAQSGPAPSGAKP